MLKVLIPIAVTAIVLGGPAPAAIDRAIGLAGLQFAGLPGFDLVDGDGDSGGANGGTVSGGVLEHQSGGATEGESGGATESTTPAGPPPPVSEESLPPDAAPAPLAVADSKWNPAWLLLLAAGGGGIIWALSSGGGGGGHSASP